MIDGYGRKVDTSAYLNKHKVIRRDLSYFCVSPFAIGTHLGNMDDTDSELYQASIEYGLSNGINFIDTAINYRGMRSERDIGSVVSRLIDKRTIKREEIVISTKAGIIPGDIDAGLVPKDYLEKMLLNPQIIDQSDLNVVDHHRHVLAPSYYQFAIEQSKKHLGLNTIDIHYIHNPEISLQVLGADDFYHQLRQLFLFYEKQVNIGNIRYYGFATWDGFLSEPDDHRYISLERVMNVLNEVIGENHHFKFIQFPYNKTLHFAMTKENQLVKQQYLTLFEAAKKLNLTVVTSAPFNLGKLSNSVADTDSYLLSLVNEESISSIMVGMKHKSTVIRNLELIKV